MSQVRENLMSRAGYSPYCGGGISGDTSCSMPRTSWNGQQFRCGQCGWVSAFPADFIAEYRAKWNLSEARP
jgi:hypothetical protein